MHTHIETIPDFFASYRKTAWEKDISGMTALYEDDVLIFDMWDKGFVRGLQEWTSIIKEWLTSLQEERVNVVFEMIEMQESEAIAFATALIQFQAISAGGIVIRGMKNRISLGFVKTNGAWKVKHQHTSAPVDSSLKAILDI